MAKSKYVELAFADGPSSPKHSVAGYLIVSDLAGGGNRNLVLKNMNGAVARKPRAKKAAKAKDQPVPTNALGARVGFAEADRGA